MMKKLLYCLPVLLLLFAAKIEGRTPGAKATATTLKRGTLPLLFAENKGQVTDKAGKLRPDILFTASGNQLQLFLDATGIQYQFTKVIYPEGYRDPKMDALQKAALAAKIKEETFLFSLRLEGADPGAIVRREKKNIFTQHYYTAYTPKEGVINVATYEQIVYENIYPHIDWVLYSKDNKLKYDFIVRPGGDPSQIRLKIADADKVSITSAGELLMKTSMGEVREQAPASFVNGAKIPSRFVQHADGTIGFDVIAVPGATLVIDPSITWSTYYGGSGAEEAQGFSMDPTGNLYFSGLTSSSTGIAMAGGYQMVLQGAPDNFLVKCSAAGTPLWATYYGSAYATSPASNVEQGGACATDNAGNVYLLATTPGAPLTVDMSTPGAYQTTQAGGTDAYLVKFNTSGVRQWATYFGGSGSECAYGCATDATGNIFISGITPSTSGIASPGAHQTAYGGGASDLFIAKFNTSGALQWSTYLGGSGGEGTVILGTYVVRNCGVDNLGNVFVSGNTSSTSGIASPGAQQTVLNGANDAFVAKFSPTGTRLWSTYFGGNDQDGSIGNGLSTDAVGNVYLTGDTYSTTGIATPGASQTTFGGNGDLFLAKYNSTGVLQWATYKGGGEWEHAASVSVNATGNIYLTGGTYSFNSLSGGFQSANLGGADGCIFKFNSAGTLLWSSYFGGPAQDAITASVPLGQDLFILGQTLSTSGIATSGAYKTTLVGSPNPDAFLARISDVPACIPDSVVVTKTICSNQLPYTWQGNTVPAGGVNVSTDTLTNVTGCDSVLHLTLIVKPIATLTVLDTACRNEFPYVWNGISIAAPAGNTATATYTTPAANNCDSIVTLNLFVRDTSAVVITKTYCRNELPAVWNGFTIPLNAVSNPAFAIYTTVNMGGCDSVVRLSLVVRDTFAIAVYDTTCRNDFPFVWNGISVAAPAGNTTTAVYNGNSIYNCDSIVTLHLFVKDTSTYTVYDTICSNELPYTWNGITVTTGGPNAATFITPNAVNCDSVVRLHLTVHNTSAFTEVKTICSNQLPYTWNGIVVLAGGPAAATFITPNAQGCDSVVTLNLIVNNTSTSTESITICASSLPYTWNGINVTAGGPNAATYVDTNMAGCDSVVTLNLTVNPTVAPTINIAVTPGVTVPLGTPVTFTATITNGGTIPLLQWRKNGVDIAGATSASYTDFSIDSADAITCILWSNANCAFPDSALSNQIKMIVITPPPPCLVPVTLISTDIQFASALFKWAKVHGASGYEVVLDMLPSDPTSGLFTTDTAYHASAMTPGVHYFHIRTRCANGDYSPWIKIVVTILDPTGIADPNSDGMELSLYPNPNNGIFNIRATVAEARTFVDIVDKSGRAVYQAEAATPGGKLDHRVDLSGKLAQGIYLLRVSSGNQVTVIRFVYH